MTNEAKLDPKILSRLSAARHTIKNLLSQINIVENDNDMLTSDKLDKIKKIQEEITKVGMEIDSIKREIILLNAYDVN